MKTWFYSRRPFPTQQGDLHLPSRGDLRPCIHRRVPTTPVSSAHFFAVPAAERCLKLSSNPVLHTLVIRIDDIYVVLFCTRCDSLVSATSHPYQWEPYPHHTVSNYTTKFQILWCERSSQAPCPLLKRSEDFLRPQASDCRPPITYPEIHTGDIQQGTRVSTTPRKFLRGQSKCFEH